MRHAAGFALRGIGADQHLFNKCDALRHSRPGTAHVLDVVGTQVNALAEARGPQPRADLVTLATQANHQYPRKVGVHGVTREGATQHVHALAFTGHAAPRSVSQCNDTIDILEGVQITRVPEMVRDRACDRG